MAGHYASADVGRLIEQANLALNRQETCTVLRVAHGAPIAGTRRRELRTCG
jgi:hypothetical protein